MDSSINDASMESVSPTDVGDNRSPGRWPRNITNTTPISSPSGHRKIAVVSPIPYKCDDSDDDQFPDENNPVCRLPPIPASPMSPALTPPHKRLKSLRLYDTPHTPKSLLQKAQRRMCRPRNKFNLTDVSESTPSPRLPLDPLKPQANVNPFTPNNNNNSALSCSGSTGQKRPRNGFDGWVLRFYKNLYMYADISWLTLVYLAKDYYNIHKFFCFCFSELYWKYLLNHYPISLKSRDYLSTCFIIYCNELFWFFIYFDFSLLMSALALQKQDLRWTDESHPLIN